MGTPHSPGLVRLIAGLLVSSPPLLDDVHRRLTSAFGEITLASEVRPWTASRYYCGEMGEEIWRQFVSFAPLLDPADLAAAKRRTNELERHWRNDRGRRVNIDPGYVAPLKLVLATTKDAAHRVYLGDGIYAEVTLVFERGTFRPRPHTYPDYAEPEAIAFFDLVRKQR